jgi:hypothetical protein
MPLIRLQTGRTAVLGETHPAFAGLTNVLQALPLAIGQLIVRNLQHRNLLIGSDLLRGEASSAADNLGITRMLVCLLRSA